MGLSALYERLRRSVWALPLAALGALLVFAINETAYHRSSDALASLGDRGTARTQIQTLMRRLIDAETGQRGYLLTDRKDYLKPYNDAVSDVDEALKWLAGYYATEPALAKLVSELATRSGEKLSELSTTLSMYEAGKQGAWRELLMTDIGREKMEAIRVSTQQLLAVESQRVAAERQYLMNTLRVSRIGVNAMVALSLLALVLFLRQTLAFDKQQTQHANALKVERDRLEVEVAARTADLVEFAKHLQTAREDERARLARELHDEMGALLTATKLDVARLKRSLGDMSPEVLARLQHLNDTVNHGIELKRRIIEDLRPSSLSNLGLVAALEIQAREFATRSEITVATELENVRLSDNAQITVYRLVQEALTNIAKYAGATRVSVNLYNEDDRARVVVRDNGRGFELRATRRSTHGLMGMRYRVEAEGGSLRVESTLGEGTLIEAFLPMLAEGQPAAEVVSA